MRQQCNYSSFSVNVVGISLYYYKEIFVAMADLDAHHLTFFLILYVIKIIIISMHRKLVYQSNLTIVN